MLNQSARMANRSALTAIGLAVSVSFGLGLTPAWGSGPVAGRDAAHRSGKAAVNMDAASRATDRIGFEFGADVRERVMKEWGLRDVSIQRLDVRGEVLRLGDGGEGAGEAVERVSVQVDFGGHARTLVMEPHVLRSEGFKVYAGYGPGANDFAPMDREFAITTYRGWVEREADDDKDADPRVVASYFAGRLRASVHGLNAADGGGVWRLQPLSEVIEGASPDVYAVYQDADARGLDGFHCGVTAEHCLNGDCSGHAGEQAEGGFSDRGLPECLRQTDVLYDTDYEYTTHFLGMPDQVGQIVSDIEFVNNECDFVFARDMGAQHFVAGIVVRNSPSDPFSDVTAHGSLLGEFRDLWDGVPLINPDRDVAHLMTGRDLDGGVIGVAFLPSVCRQDPNVGLSQTFFSSSSLRRTLLTAHELGHQWNAPHDNQSGSACESTPSGFIMNPSIGTQPAVFSDCSKDRMTTYLGSSSGDCISSAVQGPLVRPDFATVYTGDTVDVDVLRNEVSNCGAPSFTLGSSTSAQGGTLTILNGAGPRGRNLVRYAPPAAFLGTDTFTYTVTNEVGTSTPVTASVLVLPWKQPEFPIRQGSGLHAYYYETAGVRGLIPDFSSMEPYLVNAVGAIAFSSTSGNFAGSGREDAVGAVFQGFFNATTQGVYTFFTESDDGSKMYVGDTLVVSNDGTHGMQERSGKIGLLAGRHSIRVEFFERDSGAGLFARVQGPGLVKQTISTSRLSRRLPCPTDYNSDDKIDLADLIGFLSDWQPIIGSAITPGDPGDYNGDGFVDLADLVAFVTLWQAGTCV